MQAGTGAVIKLFFSILYLAKFNCLFHLPLICCWIKGKQGLRSSSGSLVLDLWEDGIKRDTVRGLYAQFPPVTEPVKDEAGHEQEEWDDENEEIRHKKWKQTLPIPRLWIEQKKKGRKQKCVEAKEQRMLKLTARVQECLTSCQQTWLQSTLSSLLNTHRRHMGKHSFSGVHTHAFKHKRIINHMHRSNTAISAPPYVLCTFKSSEPHTSQALIREQWTPQPLCHLNVIGPFGSLPPIISQWIPTNSANHKVGACGKPRVNRLLLRHVTPSGSNFNCSTCKETITLPLP